MAEFEMIFECTFGDRASARAAVDRMVRLIPDLPVSQRATIELNIAYAMWRFGEGQTALNVLRSAFAHAQDAGVHRSAVIAALHLAELLQDFFEDEESAAWLSKADEIASQVSDPVGVYEIFTVHISLALTQENASEAQRWMRMASEQGILEASEMRKRFARAFRVRLRQLMRRRPLKSSELEGLLESLAADESLPGIQDFEFATAVFEFAARNQHGRARQIAREYLTTGNRRAVGVVTRILANAISSVPGAVCPYDDAYARRDATRVAFLSNSRRMSKTDAGISGAEAAGDAKSVSQSALESNLSVIAGST
jgi:hypothetical protein